MVKKIAIALIHGIGIHSDPDEPKIEIKESPKPKTEEYNSEAAKIVGDLKDRLKKGIDEKIKAPLSEVKKELEAKVKERLPPHGQEGMKELLTERFKAVPDVEIVIEPIYWGRDLQKQKDSLWDNLEKYKLSLGPIRKFMIEFLGDVSAYQPLEDTQSVYESIHRVIKEGLKTLATKAGPEAPLCIVAHSLGTVITYNFLQELLKSPIKGATPLEQGKTLKWLYTMGSPIPMFALRDKNPKPVSVPVWKNFFSPTDIISYPLKAINDAFKNSNIEDIAVDVGNVLTYWNPASHIEYWTDDTILNAIVNDIKRSTVL
jgi:hypothetical protein